ncbi:hypothetical protein B5E60_12240 [Alistipes sp. An116]|nr:hypothetical protein B5E60_12240 [Alistipes sp. An116]
MMNQIVFMGNGSPENGGCEAITKGTIEILNRTIPNFSYIDSYFNYEKPSNTICRNNSFDPVDYPKRWSLRWFLLQCCLHISNRLTGWLLFSRHKKAIKDAAAVLSLGGDNYSLDYGVPTRFIAMGEYVKRQHTKFVIWGASIGPFEHGSNFEKTIAKHFNQDVDLILVREEVSRQYLDSIGVRNNVFVVADPAFMMKPEDCAAKVSLPQEYICINFSDLMAKYVTNGDVSKWIEICAHAIDEIYDLLGKKMVFIPHVKSDYEFGQRILAQSKAKNAVILVDKNLNAAEMKWIISKSLCNIACRTHSTIASFSTGVPTVSLGYSIKSKGLNQQMYGHEKFLIYKEEISPAAIRNCVKFIFENLDEVRCQLEEKTKLILSESCKAGEILMSLIDHSHEGSRIAY